LFKHLFINHSIAIFQPHSDFITNPTLVSLLESLACCGARVDLFMPESGHFQTGNDRINQYRFPPTFSFWKGNLRKTAGNWLRCIQQKRIDRTFAIGNYDLIIGVDSAGIIKGWEYAKRFNLPLAYLSFEIFFRDELKTREQFTEKMRECTASQFADLIIIQDKWRAKLLAEENYLSGKNFEYLPVSSAGLPISKKDDYLRKRFNISEKKTIILHTGAFDEWTYGGELIENAATWPEDFILVIHSPWRTNNKLIQKIRQSQINDNIVLSTDSLPADEYERLAASADIGLALYKPVSESLYTGKNIQTMGLSSGKFSSYMKCGIPVVSINQKTYAELLIDYDFGKDISSFDQMVNALSSIRSNYDYHRAEAQRLYSEKLDFNIYWPKISKSLSEIIKR